MKEFLKYHEEHEEGKFLRELRVLRGEKFPLPLSLLPPLSPVQNQR